MKIGPEKIRITLAIFTAFLLVFCPAYFHYNDIVEIDFLSAHTSFENPDQENLQSDKQNKTKIFVQNLSSVLSSVLLFSIADLPDDSPRLFYFFEPTAVLRC